MGQGRREPPRGQAGGSRREEDDRLNLVGGLPPRLRSDRDGLASHAGLELLRRPFESAFASSRGSYGRAASTVTPQSSARSAWSDRSQGRRSSGASPRPSDGFVGVTTTSIVTRRSTEKPAVPKDTPIRMSGESESGKNGGDFVVIRKRQPWCGRWRPMRYSAPSGPATAGSPPPESSTERSTVCPDRR